MKLVDESIASYSRLLATVNPTPGGGSTSALEALLGARFIAKIAGISAQKDEYNHSAEKLNRIIEDAEKHAAIFERLIDEDTLAYNTMNAALKLPRRTEDEKNIFMKATQDALCFCVQCPFELLESAFAVLQLAKELSKEYYRATASDMGIAAFSLKTAASGAYLTIRINLKQITDTDFVAACKRKSDSLIAETTVLADAVSQKAKNDCLD
jgi:formiminotetrahydrofolate cyclodeaminase